jgi:hypothetical protein
MTMNGRLEDEILKVFRRTNGTVSPNTIRAFVQVDPRDISEKLDRMEKQGTIKSIGKRRVSFYQLQE